MLSDLYRDAIELTRASARGDVSLRPLLRVLLLSDPFVVLALMLSLLVFIGESARDAFDPRK